MKKNLLLFVAIATLIIGFKPTAKAQGILLPIQVYDSLSTYCDLPADVTFYVYGGQVNGYLPTDSITMDVAFGDGTATSGRFPLVQGGSYYSINLNHTYTLPGQFSVQFMVTWPDNDVDTLVYNPVYIGPCNNVQGTVYIDDNSNCIMDNGETALPYVSVIASDALGNTVNYAYTDSAGNYSLALPLGFSYSISLSPFLFVAGSVNCPVGGAYTIPATGAIGSLNFGISCNTQFDLDAHLWGWRFRPGFDGYISTSINNNSCTPVSNGDALLTLDPLVSFVGDYYGIPSSSVSGQEVTWNNINAAFWNNNHYSSTVVSTSLAAQIGDSVCFTYSAMPILNDANPSNNVKNTCYAVSNSWDPNAKDVYPRGNGAQGYVPQNTTFDYIIHFQNTGTDTAFNISIVDTMDTDLDFASLQIVGSSHPMSIDVIDNQVIKFNFYNIMLPDSGTNLAASEGYIMYKIKSKPSVPAGTEWKNTAYIYFDFNAPVITNTTLNTLELVTSAAKIESNQKVLVLPNPANDICTIKLSDNFTGMVQITDISGRVIQQLNISNSSTFVLELQTVPNGLYQLNAIGKKITFHAKLEVQH